MTRRPAWKRARDLTITFGILAVGSSIVRWLRHDEVLDISTALFGSAAVVALVVFLATWVRRRSEGAP